MAPRRAGRRQRALDPALRSRADRGGSARRERKHGPPAGSRRCCRRPRSPDPQRRRSARLARGFSQHVRNGAHLGGRPARRSGDRRRTLARRRRRQEPAPLVLGPLDCAGLRRSDRSARRRGVAGHHAGCRATSPSPSRPKVSRKPRRATKSAGVAPHLPRNAALGFRAKSSCSNAAAASSLSVRPRSKSTRKTFVPRQR